MENTIISIVSMLTVAAVSLLTPFVTDHIAGRRAKKDRIYQEKRDAYIGLLTSIHNAGVEKTEKAGYEYGLWQTKCAIFGSNDVTKWADKFPKTTVRTLERTEAGEKLLAAIRKDLNSERA